MQHGSERATFDRSMAEMVSALPATVRKAILADLTDDQYKALQYDWRFWARPKQLEPPGDWRTWLFLAGRGAGKSRTGSEWIRSLLCGATPLSAGVCRRVALVGETAADVRDVMVQGDSGILSVHPPDFRPIYQPTNRKLTWPNGAVAMCYNGTEPDQLRGPQYDAAWVDELAKLQYMQDVWHQLQLGLRLGLNPRAMVSTTPRPLKLIKQLVADPTCHVTPGSTFENASNLAQSFLEVIRSKYEGTRLGRQEIYAEVIDDNPFSLWKQSNIDENRIIVKEIPEMARIVVAIDPPVTTGESADECGIIVAGKGQDGHGYLIEDASEQGLSPRGWAELSVSRYYKWEADAIVVEVNNGGELVTNVIAQVDDNVPIRSVRASHGKVTRAEPVAALYEQGKVHHVGQHNALEDQMCDFTSDFDKKSMGYSPDRVDALVWAMSELMLGRAAPNPRVRRL